MSSPVRVRFAPSPTGQVHIGNIRAAIFNYLFARSCGGRFLLRVEDTDRERSTPEAVDKLMEVLDWLELRPDEPPLFQSTRLEAHQAAAAALVEAGHAYLHARGQGEAPALYFRIPGDPVLMGDFLREVGPVELPLTAGEVFRLDATGIQYVGVSRKGKPDPGGCCLAGMAGLEVLGEGGRVLFRLGDAAEFQTSEALALRFLRRELVFQDQVKGPLAKPLDSIKDQVIVRADGFPVFHLANVCDDIEQAVTHVIRGDDHVENTFRHIGLFRALGAEVPVYAHLPMIVNAQGKPYSKRDGDAFVGDFRDKGYLPEALFNYLTLLGWSPGDDREKMNRDELIAAFSLERVQRSPAQMDLQKLANLNGRHIGDLPEDLYLADVRDLLSRRPWAASLSAEDWAGVARLMRPRLRTYADVDSWRFFADEDFDRPAAAMRRGLGKPAQRLALERIADELDAGQDLPAARAAAVAALEIDEGSLNLPLRVALTGETGGPDLELLLQRLPPASLARRIRKTLSLS